MYDKWVAAGMTLVQLVAVVLLMGCAAVGSPPLPTPVTNSRTGTPEPAAVKRLENSQLGFSLLYPANWEVTGAVLATGFAGDAYCESVRIVDDEPPPGSGSALIQQSFVQICGKPLTDDAPLDLYLRNTYGNSAAARFQMTELAGMRSYQETNANGDATIFIQTRAYRIQIVASAATAPDLQAERRSQIQRILESIAFP